MSTIQSEHFTKAVFMLMEESFENGQGIYLDKNTSMFETLAGISAEEASIPVGGKCATLAAHVKHVAFYLEVIERFMRDPKSPRADWGEVWRTVSSVTAEEWQAIQAELRTNYQNMRKYLESVQEWPNEMAVGTAMAIIAHSAYHLGEIRQALCVLKTQ
ncbi:MAG: hypothetical protein C0410_00755 [Anaerolinea sp.]|nr:hypothetical protein [Anaerolinea sp.]